MTTTKTLYALHMKAAGRAMRVNDSDDRTLLTASKAHALRIIAWLGLTGVSVRPATDEEVAHGHLDKAKASAR